MAQREELSSLFGCKKQQTSYGALRKQDNSNEFYIKHYVKTDETLAGICLKYGVQMETVKRVNKIWTNDSLFLRDYLLIPVSSQHAEDINSSSFNGASTALSISEISVKVEPAVKVLTRQDVKALQGSSKLASVQSKAVETISSEPTLNDFLNRVDNSLNKLRVDVERLDRSTEFTEDVTNPLSFLPAKKTTRYAHRQRSNGSNSDSDISFQSAANFEPMVCQSLERFSEVHEDMVHL